MPPTFNLDDPKVSIGLTKLATILAANHPERMPRFQQALRNYQDHEPNANVLTQSKKDLLRPVLAQGIEIRNLFPVGHQEVNQHLANILGEGWEEKLSNAIT